jgi:hypothetical protein
MSKSKSNTAPLLPVSAGQHTDACVEEARLVVMHKDRRHIAYHEAGHAVVAWALGVRFKHVTIKQTKKRGGYLHIGLKPDWMFKFNWERFEDGLSPRQHKYIENQIMISFAGATAQLEFTGKDDPDGCVEDFSDIERWLKFIDHENPPPFASCKSHAVRTKELVKECWPLIVAVADALVDRERLAYNEFLNIVEPAGDLIARGA